MSRHSLDEARAVLAESRRLLDRDLAARKRTVDVRAAGTRKPAAPAKGFMDYVAEEMGRGKTRSQAVRAVAIAEPALHQAYLAQATAKHQDRVSQERAKAARLRAVLARG